jgi:hypothetical protein
VSANKQTRPLFNIAHDIRRDWKNVNYAAKPYLAAMFELDRITDQTCLTLVVGLSPISCPMLHRGAARGEAY